MKKLHTWNEIADKLGISVRTAQTYEKERGLPVHRLGDGPRAPVFAFEEELEQWLHGKRSVRNGDRQSSRLTIVTVLAFGLVSLGGLSYWGIFSYGESNDKILDENPWHGEKSSSRTSNSGIPVRCEVEGRDLRVSDSKNQLVWQKFFPRLSRERAVSDWDCKILRFSPEQSPIVLLNHTDQDTAWGISQMKCFTDSGVELWSFDYGRVLTRSGRRFGPSFHGRFVELVRVEDELALLSIATHQPWYPSQVALIEPLKGNLIKEYFHPGRIYSHTVGDLDSDARPELIVGGVNNPGPGPGRAGMAVLELNFETYPKTPSFFDQPHSWPVKAYILFPRPDIVTNDANPMANFSTQKVVDIRVVSRHLLSARVRIKSSQSLFYALKVSGNAQFRAEDLRISDGFFQEHVRLEREGVLDHSFGEADKRRLLQIGGYCSTPNGNRVDPTSSATGTMSPE